MNSLAIQSPEGLRTFLESVRQVNWEQAGFGLGIVLAASLIGQVLFVVLFRVVAVFANRTTNTGDDRALELLRGPSRWFLSLTLVRWTLPLTPLYGDGLSTVRQVLLIAMIFSVAWFIWRGVLVVEELARLHFDTEAANNLRARQVTTQVRALRNVVGFLIWVLAAALSLTTFEGVRHFGTTLLASAGVAGIVLGFAAQRSISTVIAGIQIAFSQPIRVDDVVVVEGEWGRIEEITLTFVIVKIWDLRRLVLPINYFIEQPFQNWTRNEARILGTVYLDVDYSMNLEALRAELKRIVEASESWDGEVQAVVVTEAKERCMQVRALVSAADSGQAWDLRCEVREKLLAFVQREHPSSVPLFRASLAKAESA